MEENINPVMSLEDPQNHDWPPDLKRDWIDEPYPEDVTELLLDDDINVDEVVEYDEYEYDTSSDEEYYEEL